MADEKSQPKRIKRTNTERSGEFRAAVKPQQRESSAATKPTKPTASTQATTSQASPKPTTTTTQAQAAKPSATTLDITSLINAWSKKLAANSLAQTYFGSVLSRKEAAARKQFGVPNSEKVFLVLDATIFGTCKAGLALCTKGIYLRDTAGTARSIAWAKLPACSIAADAQTLAIDKSKIVTLDGAPLASLLNSIKKKIAG